MSNIQAGSFVPSSPPRSNAPSSSSLPRDGSRLVPDAHTRTSSSLTTTPAPGLPGTPPRDLRQRPARLPAEGELLVASPTAAPRESKTDTDRETKHATRTPKRRREEQEQEAPRSALEGKSPEPEKKPRAQRWIDPPMGKYVASHGGDRIAALRAALSSSDPRFLEGLVQHLRNHLAQSQSYATAVQTVACEIGLALRPAFTSQRSADAACVHLFRGLLREHDGAGSAVCTTDLADIAQGLRDLRLSESEGNPSDRFAHHARLLSRALEVPTLSREHARALYLQVAVPSSYPAHMFGADAAQSL